MAYFYYSIIFKDTKNLEGFTPSQITQNDLDKSDFETNFKALSIKINEIILSSTIFKIDLSYTNLKSKIVSPLTWNDVKLTEDSFKYTLNLFTENPI